MSTSNKFSSVLKLHDPKNKKSHSILRFFSEDLDHDDKLIFIKSIFERGSWILSTEISVSGSSEIKLYTKEIFYKAFRKWVNERISHSTSIESKRKVGFIPQVYTLEFREVLISLKNLDFSDDIMELLHRMMEKCQISYSKKFLEDSCWIIFEEFNQDELEKFFTYFFSIYIKSRPIYLTNFFYIFLSNLAYSSEIFNLSESFLIKFRSLVYSLKLEDYKSDYNILISIFLIEYIENKELNISRSEYKLEVDNLLDTLEKGDFNNLNLLKFLKRFNYNFEGFDFNKDIQNILDKLDYNIRITSNAENGIKKNLLHHYLKNSEQYFELFLFCLENIAKDDVADYILKFVNLIDRLRECFSTLFWFKEFLNFEKIKGSIIKEIPHGFKLQIDEDCFSNKTNEQFSGMLVSEEFFQKNAFGFVKSESIKEFNRLVRFQNQNEEKEISIDNNPEENIKEFLISNVNYSTQNKWGVLTFIPYNEIVHNKIARFQLKAFFPFVELFLIEKAYEILLFPAPFKKNNGTLSRSFSFDCHNDYDIVVSESDFWDLLKEARPFLYKTIYEKAKMDEESFNEILRAYENDEVILGKIDSLSGGGMYVNIKGIRAFLPGSQIDFKPVGDHSQYLDQIMDFKILKITKETKNIVVSHRALTESEYEIRRETFINNLKKGQVLEGTVKNITNYGVFVDLGYVDGLIYIADLSWLKVNHPQDLVEVDQKINVVVLDFYLDGSKIALGLKQLDQDFVNKIKKIVPGCVMDGEIFNITNYGIFYKTNDDINVLIHISEICYSKVPYEYMKTEELLSICYKIGNKISALIITNDADTHQLSASLKKIEKGREKFFNLRRGQVVKGRVIATSCFGGVVMLSNGLLACINISEIDWIPIPKNTQLQLEYVNSNLESKELDFIILQCHKYSKVINLGLKQFKRSYWKKLSRNVLHRNYDGIVVRILNDNYIIELENGLDGSLSKERIEKPLSLGSNIKVNVFGMNSKKQTLTLKLSSKQILR